MLFLHRHADEALIVDAVKVQKAGFYTELDLIYINGEISLLKKLNYLSHGRVMLPW